MRGHKGGHAEWKNHEAGPDSETLRFWVSFRISRQCSTSNYTQFNFMDESFPPLFFFLLQRLVGLAFWLLQVIFKVTSCQFIFKIHTVSNSWRGINLIMAAVEILIIICITAPDNQHYRTMSYFLNKTESLRAPCVQVCGHIRHHRA